MNQRLRSLSILLCGAWVLCALGALLALRHGRPLHYTDGQQRWTGADFAAAPMLLRDPPTPVAELPGPIRGRVQPLGDGRLLYGLARGELRTELVIFDPSRPDAEPEPVTPLRGPGHDFAPAFAADGSLLFASDRPGGAGGYDIYRAARLDVEAADGPWFGAPVALGAAVNTAADEVDPAPFADELVFMRSSTGAAGDRRTTLHWLSDPDAAASMPLDLTTPREPGAGGWLRDPVFDPSGAALWFVRQQPGGRPELRCMPRLGSRWAPDHATSAWRGDAALRGPAPTADGLALFLLGTGDQPLWWQSTARPVQPWWPGQLPLERWLLRSLLVAILFGTLLALGARWRHVDVITWFLLASLLVHLLLYLWLSGMLLPEPADGEGADDGNRIAVRMLASTGDSASRGGDASSLLAHSLRRASPAAEIEVDAPGALTALGDARPVATPVATGRPPSRRSADRSFTPVATTAPALQDDAAPPSVPMPHTERSLAPRAAAGITRAEPASTRQSAATAPRRATAGEPSDAGPTAPRVATLDHDSESVTATRELPGGGRRVIRGAGTTQDPAMARGLASPTLRDRDTSAAAPVAANPAARHLDDLSASLGSGSPTGSQAAEQAFRPPTGRAADRPHETRTRPAVSAPTADLPAGLSASPLARSTPRGRRRTPRGAGPASRASIAPGPAPSAPLRAAVTQADALRDAPATARDGRPARSLPTAARELSGGSTSEDTPSLATPMQPTRGRPSTAATEASALDAPAVASLGATRTGNELPRGRRRAPRTLDAEPDLYANRFGPRKQAALEQFGGTVETERAVASGLAYLAARQRDDGLWGDPRRRSRKYGETRVGKSGLCLLAFLGAGHLPGKDGPHRGVVDAAVSALLRSQDARTGHFGRSSSYSHGITTYALAECYALTRDESLRPPLQNAVDWILRNQDGGPDPRNRGGWGYFSATLRAEDGYARSSVTAWMVMALESARRAGLRVPNNALAAAGTFLAGMFDLRRGYVLYSKDPARLRSTWRTLPASTPASTFCLQLLVGRDELPAEMLDPALQFTLERRPRAFERVSTDVFVRQARGHPYFWYYGTLCCFLAGGETWQAWNDALREVLPPAQLQDGSWPPIGAYARDYAGDRDDDACYTTALAVLSLEVYYRYFTPLLEPPAPGTR